MKFSLFQMATTKWSTLTAFLTSSASRSFCDNTDSARFPTIVAQTTEGQIMDGPRGLQLITPFGPTPVQQTPEGFVVYKPFPHFLHPTSGLDRMLQK